jgi:hypothetical protein
MLRSQVFSINNTQVTFENDGENATITTISLDKNQSLINTPYLKESSLTLPLPEFRKLMDILSKTKFMFSNENK